MKSQADHHYYARMQRVLVYIDQHLDEDLDVEILGGIAAFSKYHFQRLFASMFGISVARYIQLIRMKQAANRIAFRPSHSILDIALDSGYGGPEAFARVFRRHFAQSPTEFRRDPVWNSWHAAIEPLNLARSRTMTANYSSDQVRIIEFPATPVAVMQHCGDPARIGDTVRRFIDWRRVAGIPPKTSRTFNVFHSDPDDTPVEEFRLDICASSKCSVEPNGAGVVDGLIPAGRCAVLRIKGSSDDLRVASRFLYAEWLPASGEEPRDFPFFAERVTLSPDVPQEEAVTDLFLPLV